jgi:hypothetical protein
VPAVFWFAVGGARDVGALLLLLKTAPRDPTDDGRVTAPAVPLTPAPELVVGSRGEGGR